MLWRMRSSVVPTVIVAVADNFLYINEMNKCPVPKTV